MIIVLLAAHEVYAQSNVSERYDSSRLGLSFSYPTGWDVEQLGNRLVACDLTDLNALANQQTPEGLVIWLTEGPRSDFGLTNVQSLPELLATVHSTQGQTTTTVGGYQALRGDRADNQGGAVAIRIDEQRWVLIYTQSTDWANDKPLFDEILDTFAFGPIGAPLVARTVAIKYGAKLHEAFNAAEPSLRFTFGARIGEQVSITVVADSGDPLDPAIVLVGPDSSVVAQNDDSLDPKFGLTNARLVSFPIPRSGTYTIEVHRVGNMGSSFTLTLDNKPPSP